MSNFKFELGQTVKHIAAANYGGIKYVVIQRGTTECIDGSKENQYLCSFDGGRAYWWEYELQEIKKEDAE